MQKNSALINLLLIRNKLTSTYQIGIFDPDLGVDVSTSVISFSVCYHLELRSATTIQWECNTLTMQSHLCSKVSKQLIWLFLGTN